MRDISKELALKVKHLCEGWAEDDDKVKELATPYLTQEQIDGDLEAGFVDVVQIVEMLVKKLDLFSEAMEVLAKDGARGHEKAEWFDKYVQARIDDAMKQVKGK